MHLFIIICGPWHSWAHSYTSNAIEIGFLDTMLSDSLLVGQTLCKPNLDNRAGWDPTDRKWKSIFLKCLLLLSDLITGLSKEGKIVLVLSTCHQVAS